MVIQIILGFCGEIGALGTIQCTSEQRFLCRIILFLVVWVPQFLHVTFSFRINEGILMIVE